jgi:hypothetical protein
MAPIGGRPVCSLDVFRSECYLKRPTREHLDPAPDGSGYLPDRLPLSLLLVIFSIAERLTDDEHPVPRDGTMWSAGESYLSAAKHMISALFPIIDLRGSLTLFSACTSAAANPYAASRASTCQAYLLMTWREIGIGATSQAYIFLGCRDPHGSRYGAEPKLGQVSRGFRSPLFRHRERNAEPYLVVCSRS